ncbi:hypothetical protein BUALT_Bualt14G0132500 [Buddleja alternifolia]|uniref:CG-1 domain-containing protein n=1 Tax=Buddleja alternifolia TaxID=168488 RepID=A0AAV6WHG5_9LAMI|nr:hypothetical protein BUALT_Bualt14G0132500 [Buddleja alternifolia]
MFSLLTDLEQILQEAPHRWFRPPEICEILSNHSNYYLTPEPPLRPPDMNTLRMTVVLFFSAGSLFLFDRKVLRYFRKDGHSWRKKKDGKTVREAHEKLKVRGVDALHCYYAHGEDNEKFQRRIYWMLDMQLEHIVLVHYREVNEGQKVGLSHLLSASYAGSQLGSAKSSSASQSEQSCSRVQASYTSNPYTSDWNEHRLPSEFGDRDSGFLGSSSVAHPIQGFVTDDTSLTVNRAAGSLVFSSFYALDHDEFKHKLNSLSLLSLQKIIAKSQKHNLISGLNDGNYLEAASSSWANAHCSSKTLGIVQNQKPHQLNTTDFLSQKLVYARLDVAKIQNVSTSGAGLFSDTPDVVKVVGDSDAAPERSALVAGIVSDEAAELKKLDSFGRWMDREIGGDCDDSLVASDSTNYWSTLDTANDDKEVSSLSLHMHLDTDSLSPSLSREQLFSISDFAPVWAYSGVETKVLVMGTFLVDKKDSEGHKWCCMFGEIEVSGEVLSNNVIRCQVPFHAPGRIPFYVTCGNRLACSEVREFEYLEKPLRFASPLATKSAPEEVSVQIRLAKLLCLGLERKWLDCSVVDCDKCKVKVNICSLRGGIEKTRENFEEVIIEDNYRNFKDKIIQNLLKDKLYEWLVCKAHEGDKGPHVLDDEGQGIIHLTASLGYMWALGPIIAAGVSPNFRDKRGRTSLHWASYFGREETVITLIKLGTAAGAVDDPTSEFLGGRTAADLASDRGHKGISGYLAEADLNSHHLLSLSVTEGLMGTSDATTEIKRTLHTITEEVVPINAATNEDLSLKRSLAAVTKSAHAAALIQAAFRAHSFHHRQLTSCTNEVSEDSLDLVALCSLTKVQKVGHFDDYLHSAAIKVQKKYRGWKGRKDFLKIRSRIVKLQAHVRGHQVRKQYKKVLWSVSVVEKVILRWRRKKSGLRGFHTEKASEGAPSDSNKNDEYDYLQIARKLKVAGVEKALERVQSMVRHPEARDQYMRLVVKFENFELNNDEST